jgi:lipopolysaccharide export system permease protein
MYLVDRYIVWLFARVFLVCFVSLLGMYVVGDLVNHLHDILEFAGSSGGLWKTFLAYYGPQVPWFFDLIGRVVALTAAVFAVTWLQRNNEMTALMAAGISRWRIIKPLVISVAVVGLLAVANREIVLPRLRMQLSRDARNLRGDRATPIHSRYDHATEIFLHGKNLLPGEQKILQPRFRLPSSLGRVGRQIVADAAYAYPPTAQRPAGYLLTGVSEPHNLADVQSAFLGQRAAILSPADTPWLKQDQCFVVSDVPFSLLQGGSAWRQFSSTWELASGVRNPSLDYGADICVAIHARLLQPVLDMTLLFLGLPLVMARDSRNMFVAAGMCLLMVTIFLIVVLASHAMGMNYLLAPALAAWGPLVIFIPTAMAMSEPLRR